MHQYTDLRVTEQFSPDSKTSTVERNWHKDTKYKWLAQNMSYIIRYMHNIYTGTTQPVTIYIPKKLAQDGSLWGNMLEGISRLIGMDYQQEATGTHWHSTFSTNTAHVESNTPMILYQLVNQMKTSYITACIRNDIKCQIKSVINRCTNVQIPITILVHSKHSCDSKNI